MHMEHTDKSSMGQITRNSGKCVWEVLCLVHFLGWLPVHRTSLYPACYTVMVSFHVGNTGTTCCEFMILQLWLVSNSAPEVTRVMALHAPQHGTHRTMLHIVTPHPEPYHFTVTCWCITFAHKTASITVLTTHSAQQFPTRQMLLSPANPCDRHRIKICGSYCETIALSQPHFPHTNWNCSCKEKDSYSPRIGPEIKKVA